jgi:hypothetical protein
LGRVDNRSCSVICKTLILLQSGILTVNSASFREIKSEGW